MEGEFRSELVLPNEAGALGLARAYVRELATQGDLPGEAVEALATAIEGVCREVIERGFEPGERATFRLVGTLTAAVLGLAIHERGLPFDPSAPGAGGDARRGLAAGATWDLLRQTVDHAHWLNHGKAGMELRLLKHRPQGDIAEHLPAAALTPYRADEPLAHQQDYTIRRMRPDEAIQVAQCVYRAYGYSYGNADFYYPERIAHENVTGRLVSVVAVDAAGAVVGHLALERPEPRPVAESGAAVVAPAHRGRHLLERMRGFLEEEAARLGLLGVFGEPVTSHTYSQRMEEDFGAHACGVLLGGMPRSTRFKHIRAEPLGQRESNLLYFKYLAAPPPSTVYAPAQHRALLERIYGNLGTPVEYGAPEPARGAGEVAVFVDHCWQYGEIRVERVGADTATEIGRARRDLSDTARAQVIYLRLPLAQAGTPELCRAAEAEGFFFAGVGVGFADDGDVLYLQYLGVPLDPARLQVASPFARELVAYVAAERERVSRPATGGAPPR